MLEKQQVDLRLRERNHYKCVSRPKSTHLPVLPAVKRRNDAARLFLFYRYCKTSVPTLFTDSYLGRNNPEFKVSAPLKICWFLWKYAEIISSTPHYKTYKTLISAFTIRETVFVIHVHFFNILSVIQAVRRIDDSVVVVVNAFFSR